MTAGNAAPIGTYPGRAAIDAYGNGGFRFADMSHRGSLLILPDRMCAWAGAGTGPLALDSLAGVLAELTSPWFLLLGTGERQIFPSPEMRAAFRAKSIGLEVMDTGAAARTFNVLLAEGRPVAAALLAV